MGDVFEFAIPCHPLNPQIRHLLNLGTMTITGPVDFYNDGVLDNFGTIIQTGTGNLQLGTDGTFPTTLKNEAGAYYLLEGDGGLTEISDSGSVPGQTSLSNAGTIRKTAGTGTSYFSVLGSITSTGTIEADSGTISLDPTLGISQLVGNALTGGTWNALDGASLQFPGGTAITSNQGKLTPLRHRGHDHRYRRLGFQQRHLRCYERGQFHHCRRFHE